MRVFRHTNGDIADVFEKVADLLSGQDAMAYRVRAYVDAARTLRALHRPVREILEVEGRAGLEKLPTIGKRLALAIEELVHTGRFGLLERLQGQVSPEDLFTTVPGIGDELAHRIFARLGVETLEELELAAHDGRLESVEGFGVRRTRLVREALGGRLSLSARRRARLIHGAESAEPESLPPVELVLEVDARYRRLAADGRLTKIAPRRFNPEGQAWLPIMHVDQAGWSFTAMYSNTARAHALDRTDDWVVIFHERDGHEGQCTVVTEYRGALAGQRVVRGREVECAREVGRPPPS